MRSPLASVITLVYNGMPFLEESVYSILSQDFENFEYIIIDDCSTDNSLQFLHSLQDDRIKIIKNKYNIGVSRSFNKALAFASSEYIIRQDQDDVSLPSRIKEQVEYLNSNPSVSVACSWEYVINNKGIITEIAKGKIDNYGDPLASIFLGLCPIWHPSLACRIKAIKDIGGFNENYKYAEDYDVTARLILNRQSVHICQQFHLNVRRHYQQQSQKFKKPQQNACLDMQYETLSKFISNNDELSLLHLFFSKRLEISKLNERNTLKFLYKSYQKFISRVSSELNLDDNEVSSFKRRIYSRLGLGIYYTRYFHSLPFNLTFIIFLILSPQYVLTRFVRIFQKKFDLSK